MRLELIEKIDGEFQKLDGTLVRIKDFSDPFVSLRVFGLATAGTFEFSQELFAETVVEYCRERTKGFNGIILGNAFFDVQGYNFVKFTPLETVSLGINIKSQ